jgi:hypothetical protein
MTWVMLQFYDQIWPKIWRLKRNFRSTYIVGPTKGHLLQASDCKGGLTCNPRFWSPETFKFGQLWGLSAACSNCRLMTNKRWENFGWHAVPFRMGDEVLRRCKKLLGLFGTSFWLTIPLDWHALGYATTSFLSSLSGGLYASPDPEPLSSNFVLDFVLVICFDRMSLKDWKNFA